MRIVRAADQPFVPAGHENALSPGVVKKVLFHRSDFQPGAIQMVNWAKMAVGNSFAPHYHEDMQEVFVLFRGSAKITVGGEMALLAPGDAVLIDAREIHQMRNIGEEDVEYLAIGITPGTGGRTVVVPSMGEG